MKIVKQTLSDQIYNILKEKIITQEIPPGSKLINRQLQKRFNVSSSPVRDAINHLHQDGLIEEINQSGATVISLDLQFYLEVNELLMVFSKIGIDLAGKKAKMDNMVPKLRKSIQLQKQYVDSKKYYDYDYLFHKTFIDFSENSRLIYLYEHHHVLHLVLTRHFHEPETKQLRNDSISMHEKITNYFEKGKIQLAMEAMELHHLIAQNVFTKMYDLRPT